MQGKIYGLENAHDQTEDQPSTVMQHLYVNKGNMGSTQFTLTGYNSVVKGQQQKIIF